MKNNFLRSGFLLLAVCMAWACAAQLINRKAVVERHTVINTTADTLASLSVGNGTFAFTADVTGLQSFPDEYAHGVPLGTQSEWGWHSFPNTKKLSDQESLRAYALNGRSVTYMVQMKTPERSREASDYFRINEHRLQLANIGLEITKKDGSLYKLNDVKNTRQTLDMWTGEIHSTFTVEGVPVEIFTYGDQQADGIAFRVKSPLAKQGRLRVRIRLPYPTGGWADMGNNWKDDNKHSSGLRLPTPTTAEIKHTLDTTNYFIGINWKGAAGMKKLSAHYYVLTPKTGEVDVAIQFAQSSFGVPAKNFSAVKKSSLDGWEDFWKSGAAVDFAGSTDLRAKEIERRVILSEYLTKVNCAGNNPPQETGLTYNSWYGKPHIEMHWWHGIHFALWGRPQLLEKSMAWYPKVAGTAKEIAQRQGYEGVRWQKMTDNDGREVPSSIGAFLIWQQPHFIYYSELLYEAKNDKAVLEKYKDLVFATADFMASFAYYDPALKRYILGKGVIAAQERFKAEETFNPTYELVYWHWALQTAQEWRQRLGLPRNAKWDAVLKDLSPLPKQGNKYLFTESATDSYTNPEFKTDHPSVFGALGMMPGTPMMDSTVMKNTFDWIWQNWSWNKTWGWDFPMTAMTATRLGMPEKAVEALLMPIQTNTYLPNGHNYQDDRLTIYLPGNGGVLAAVALMCAGWEGSGENPGFPKDGKWKVKWEGLQKSF